MSEPNIPRAENPATDGVLPIVLARFRPGVVGETKRVCHIVPVPDLQAMPEWLTAFCGTRIGPGQAERLTQITGMPCELCIAIAPLPDEAGSFPGGDRPELTGGGDDTG